MADSNKIIGIETKNINKINLVESKNISKIGNNLVKFDVVPAGLIVFFNDTTIPDGWTRFTSADDKMIIGASDTKSPNSSGGNNTPHNFNTSSSTAGSHGDVGSYLNVRVASNLSCTLNYTTSNAAGDHSHTIGQVTYNPNKRTAIMIKSLEDRDKFPQNSLLFSTGFQNLTNITDFNSKYLESNTNITNINEVKSVILGSSGDHIHIGTTGLVWCGNSDYDENITSGIHTPTMNLNSVTDNLKKVLLSLWTNASQEFDLNQNMIAMWESLTPPDGWLLCNGSNGTPDLRDCFIYPVSSGSENISQQGNNTIDLIVPTGNISHSASHTHQRNEGLSGGTNFLHDTTSWSHSHSHNLSNVNNISWLPPYYALSFIMKAS